MAIKKIRERMHNGGTSGTEADFDIIHYETSEDIIIGQVQQLGEIGYRKYPGGLIEQWGTHYFDEKHAEGIIGVTIELPVTFPKKLVNVQVSLAHEGEPDKVVMSDITVASDANTTAQIGIRAVKNGDFKTGDVRCDYRVLGY